MADKKECQICRQAIKEKYKNNVVWKVLAIVFICISVLFICLYFCSGDVVIDKEYTQENIINGDGSESGNNNSQTNIIELKDNSIMIGLIVAGFLISGGVLGGCAICKVKNNSKEHN